VSPIPLFLSLSVSISAFLKSTNSTLRSSPLHLNRFQLASLPHPAISRLSSQTFEVGIFHPITLSSEDFRSLDITARQIARSSSLFQDCKFRALSSVHGETEETSGAAVFSDSFDVSFKSCTFSGNSAVVGACCFLCRGSFEFDLCNFTNNRATFEAGAIAVDSAKVRLSESNFVQNQAELYVGVLKAVNSTVIGDSLIFHANRAIFHSAVMDADSSIVEMAAVQFSANRVDNEEGGIVHSMKGGRLRLVGCNFETIARGNETTKAPIRADGEAQVVIKQCCFDTSERSLRDGIDGAFSRSIGTIFNERCPCSHVTLPQVFDFVEKTVKLADSLSTRQFIVTVVGLAGITLVAVLLMVCESTLLTSTWHWVVGLLKKPV
jgi:hypothetical protein